MGLSSRLPQILAHHFIIGGGGRSLRSVRSPPPIRFHSRIVSKAVPAHRGSGWERLPGAGEGVIHPLPPLPKGWQPLAKQNDVSTYFPCPKRLFIISK